MSDTTTKIIVGAAVFSLLPIWRQSPKYGMNLWEYLAHVSQDKYEPFGHPHLLYNVAVNRAREAHLV